MDAARHSLPRVLALSVWSIAVLGCGAQAPPQTPSIPAPPATQAVAAPREASARCEVWNRELSFAGSVATHDERAFVEHVHHDARFVDGEKETLRGRDAILARWRPLIAGTNIALSWHPTSVEASNDPNIAISRGPFLLEDLRPNAAPHFRRGIFQSIWVKDADGAWRVFVDGGTPPPIAITEDEAVALKRDLHASCD